MRTVVTVQSGGGSRGGRVIDLLSEMADLCELNWLGVGTAYASVSGLRTLLSTIQNVASSQWVIGLDDYLTHPSVVDVISTLPGAEIRVAGELVSGVRFHPKVYAAVGRGGRNSWLIGGSANMTTSGLSENSEVAIALRATRREDIQTIRDSWPSIWKLGEPPSQSLMRDYRESFAARAAKKPPLQRPLGGVLVDDDATIDPSVANTIWIEVGKITGFQSEQLEIKGEQALFFGLPAIGGGDMELSVVLASGQTANIPVRYRSNAMWRFNLPMSIPEVARGLRPDGGRSPFVAVFSKDVSGLCLRIVRVDSAEAETMRARSFHYGTLGRTTARQYGWF